MGRISYPAPLLSQGADEDLLIEIGAIVEPGLVERHKGENGLRLWVDGVAGDQAAEDAARRFRVVLGVLRAWRPIAGELVDEQRAGLGPGSARDSAGNQTIRIGVAMQYVSVPGEIKGHAKRARDAMADGTSLRDAFEIYGRAGRDAGDYYLIGECHAKGFHTKNFATKDVSDRLDIPLSELESFNSSANNLAATRGGRHAHQSRIGGGHLSEAQLWGLEQMRDFVARVLRAWISIR